MTVYVYPKTTFKRTVRTFCNTCTKKLSRVISDSFTMSPFNRFTYEENIKRVNDKLDALRDEVATEGVTCRQCENGHA